MLHLKAMNLPAAQRKNAGRLLSACSVFPKECISPLVIPARHQSRWISTQQIPLKDSNSLLIKQRRDRPVAPHLTIYKWQYESTTSILQRFSGMALSGSLYLFSVAYLTAPIMGWEGLDSATLVAAFGSLPIMAKVVAKFVVAMPFTYHAFNGVKHLVWDTGRFLRKKQIKKAAWTVLVLSVSSAIGLAVL